VGPVVVSTAWSARLAGFDNNLRIYPFPSSPRCIDFGLAKQPDIGQALGSAACPALPLVFALLPLNRRALRRETAALAYPGKRESNLVMRPFGKLRDRRDRRDRWAAAPHGRHQLGPLLEHVECDRTPDCFYDSRQRSPGMRRRYRNRLAISSHIRKVTLRTIGKEPHIGVITVSLPWPPVPTPGSPRASAKVVRDRGCINARLFSHPFAKKTRAVKQIKYLGRRGARHGKAESAYAVIARRDPRPHVSGVGSISGRRAASRPAADR
jgi:hypothetical protein